MNGVSWGYYDKFEEINEKYLPDYGEGETLATQVVTAVNKLVYKWYNDGDVFDNTAHMRGWANDLSSYANWLYNTMDVRGILDRIYDCYNDDDYENLLKDLADHLLDSEYLKNLEHPKVGSIYDCEGKFAFEECDDEEDYYDDEDDEWV